MRHNGASGRSWDLTWAPYAYHIVQWKDRKVGNGLVGGGRNLPRWLTLVDVGLKIGISSIKSTREIGGPRQERPQKRHLSPDKRPRRFVRIAPEIFQNLLSGHP